MEASLERVLQQKTLLEVWIFFSPWGNFLAYSALHMDGKSGLVHSVILQVNFSAEILFQ